MPVAFIIALPFESFNIVDVFLGAGITKGIRHPQIGLLAIIVRINRVDLGAALFALECTAAALKNLANRHDLAPSADFRLFLA